MKYFILGFITALSIMIIAGSSYLLGRKTAERRAALIITPQPIANTVSTPTLTPTTTVSLEETLTFAIKEKSYETILPFLDEKIEFRIENQNCCGTISKEEAVKKLKILDRASDAWDFSAVNDISKNLSAIYPAHYDNSLIGISSDKYAVAFQYKNEKIIGKISVAPDYSALVN